MDFLITSTTCQIVLLALYKLLLENAKMHWFNRFYLLFALVFSLVVPFVTIEIETESVAQNAPQVLEMLPLAAGATQTESSSLEYWPIFLKGIYVIGFLIFAFRFARNIVQIKSEIDRNEKLDRNGATFVLQNQPTLPHTFLNYIFVNADDFKNGLESQLFTHEITHARQKHSFDILFIETLRTIFWFNPVVSLFKKSIQLNHEFLADEAVIANHDCISYQELLLSKAHFSSQFALASSFNFSITKKRMIMMTTTNSTVVKAAKSSCAAFTFTALFVCFSCETVAQTTPPPPPPPASAPAPERDMKSISEYYSETTFYITNADGSEQTKRFDELTDAQIKMLPPPPPRVAGDNSPYPKVLEWRFDKKGNHELRVPKIVEAYDDSGDVSGDDTNASFPGGTSKFYEFFNAEFKTPADYKGSEKIIIRFSIEADGKLTNLEFVKASNYSLVKEAARVMAKSPDWIPAMKDGKPVKSEYTLPVLVKGKV